MTARASTTKNHKAATIRLHDEVAAALRKIKPITATDGQSVFLQFPRIERFRRDLVKAGIAYKDDQGRIADFHSLRKTFGTNLARGGVPRRTAMSLMRHSDGKLTDSIYTDENLLGTWSALECLPCYSAGLSQGVSQTLVANGHGASSAVTESVGVNVEDAPANIGESHLLAFADTNGHDGGIGGSDGARTRNLCRDRAAL